VGVQIGHYQIEQLPDEQASLRSQTGGSGGGVREVDFNQNMAHRVEALLTARGVTVDILPATVPIAYTADVFIAIHADASTSGNPSGYKLSRSRFSAIPQTEDALVNILYETYGKATGLPTDTGITRNMTGYYAFNNRRRLYAVSSITPAVIIETGFLTSASDRNVLLGRPEAVAEGITEGIWQFLQSRPPLEKREKPQVQIRAIEAKLENTPVYAEGGGAIIAYLSKGQRFESYEDKGTYYSVYVPILRKTGYIRKTDVQSSGGVPSRN
jgi:N-acetylmuramoyl-L-alanine amidase